MQCPTETWHPRSIATVSTDILSIIRLVWVGTQPQLESSQLTPIALDFWLLVTILIVVVVVVSAEAWSAKDLALLFSMEHLVGFLAVSLKAAMPSSPQNPAPHRHGHKFGTGTSSI